MKKIVIVGHIHSGYQDVESLLNVCGMTEARPSRREGFSPAEIGDILNKAHAVPALRQIGGDRSIEQIEPNPVWHGMALDLMLGNLEQNVWGWADPQAITLLNYWRDLDPQITFMLVYDSPQSVLTRLGANEAASLSGDALRERVSNWNAYNAALLHFFHRNPQRCLLVHSEQVRNSVSGYLQQVRARIDAPWSERMEQLLALESVHAVNSSAGDPDATDANGNSSGMQLSTLETFTSAKKEPKQVSAANALVLFLANALIQQNPTSLQMYEELQAVANLPLEESAVGMHDPMQAWLAMAGQEQRLSEAQTLVSEKEQLIESLTQSQATAEQLARERDRTVGQQARSIETLEQSQQDSLQENELLLTQLHQVQEELERQHLASQQLQQRVQALLQSEKLSAERNKALSEAKASATKQATELGQQLDKIKKQLATDIEQGRNEASLLRAKLQAAEAKAAVPAPVVVNNNPALEEENATLLTQLHQVQEELERSYLKNQTLKLAISKAPQREPMRYGAATLVKQQLPYRLGATMVQRSHSLGGWLGMPAALVREANQFKRQCGQNEDSAFLPIESYADAHDALRVKQHLSYRLGVALLANASGPVGWIKLPWALIRETRQFRAERKATMPSYHGAS